MNILDFYTDIDMQTPALSPPVGVASLTGAAADLSTWTSIGQYTYDTGFYREIYRKFINANSGIVLGGTGAIETLFSPYNWVTGATPKMTDGNFRNAFFINVHNIGTEIAPNWRGIYFQISGSQYQDNDGYWHFSSYIRIGNYRADPDNAISTKQDRTNHKYYTSTDYEFAAEASADWMSTSQYNQIAMYSCVVNETDYFLFVLGVNNGVLHPSNFATAVLIPRSYFKYNIPKPYVGPASKDSSESSFYPDRDLIHDSIAPRDLSAAGAKNPYGFNTGNLKLYKIASNVYYGLTHRIFNAASGSLINSIGQLVNTVVGGNSHRPSDEVDTIIKSIMCCHLVPDIDNIVVGNAVAIQTIGGYPMGSTTFYTGNPLTYSIIEKTRGFVKITPTWNSFIDYEPYTTISLHIPFIGNIDIPPSVLYGNNLALHYVLDAFSGTLSVDVLINDIANGNTYIYTTLQTSCNTQLPIVGTGSNGDALLKIATGLTGAAISTSPMTKVGSIFSVYSGLADTQKSVPHTNFSQSNIAAYLDSRHCYLIIQSASPANAETFLTDKGYVAHLSGVVNDFAGSGTEMHCKFESVDLRGLSRLTDAEKREVETMLKSGVHIRKV